MNLKTYEIKPSNIHGLGVFATQDIKKGSKICDYYGEEISWKEFREKYGAYKDNSLNTYPMRRIWRIIVAKEEPYKSENVVNYINESLEANVILKKRVLYTKTDIKQGEEFFLNYPKNYNRNYNLNLNI
jgi:SET domain-containing protein